jgi:aspartyl protease family protein
MGLTTIDLDIGNVSDPETMESVTCLVDSGAVYSVIPRPVLERLNIKPISTEMFTLANGERIERQKGVALFRYEGRIGGADVIFGEDGDQKLLGSLTLEALGLSLDPLRRELKPLPMVL